MPDVFVSYTTKDAVVAQRVVDALRERGVTVWHDVDEILVGHDLVDGVFSGIRNSRYFAVLLTPRSIESPWVNRELNGALIREIEQAAVTVLPLLLEACEIPTALRSKRYANFVDDFDNGIEEVVRAISRAVATSDFGARKTGLEDRLNEKYEHSLQLARKLTEATQTSEYEYQLVNSSDENVAVFLDEVRACIELVDQLVEIEDSHQVLREHYRRGLDLASIAQDYSRQGHYAARLIEDSPSVDGWLVSAIAFASSDQRSKSVEGFRQAMRLYREKLDGPVDGSKFMKFLYRVSKHVRIGWSNESTLLSILYGDGSKMRLRLENSLAFLDEALQRDYVIDFEDPQMLHDYGSSLLEIGLSRHALRLLDQAVDLGFELRDEERKYIENERKQLDRYESFGGTGEFSMRVSAMINYGLQFGTPIDSSFEELVQDQMPEFYKEVVQEDPVFGISE